MISSHPYIVCSGADKHTPSAGSPGLTVLSSCPTERQLSRGLDNPGGKRQEVSGVVTGHSNSLGAAGWRGLVISIQHLANPSSRGPGSMRHEYNKRSIPAYTPLHDYSCLHHQLSVFHTAVFANHPLLDRHAQRSCWFNHFFACAFGDRGRVE